MIHPDNPYFEDCDWCPDVTGFCAYIIECNDGTFYKGQTNNLRRRMQEHFNCKGCRYTISHKPSCLLHFEVFQTRKEAFDREKYFKTHHSWIKRNYSTFHPIRPQEIDFELLFGRKW